MKRCLLAIFHSSRTTTMALALVAALCLVLFSQTVYASYRSWSDAEASCGRLGYSLAPRYCYTLKDTSRRYGIPGTDETEINWTCAGADLRYCYMDEHEIIQCGETTLRTRETTQILTKTNYGMNSIRFYYKKP